MWKPSAILCGVSEVFVKAMLWGNDSKFEPAAIKVGLEMVRGMDFEPMFREVEEQRIS